MNLKLNKEVRLSLAGELKRAAWAGGIIWSFLGWSAQLVWAGPAIVVWWLTMQALAHAVLAYEDSS
ncbi:MAG: hypothetical protein ACOYYI_07710 [Chloroflexota bacterium]